MDNHRHSEVAAVRVERVELLVPRVESAVNRVQLQRHHTQIKLAMQFEQQRKMKVRVDIADEAEPARIEPGDRDVVLDRLDTSCARTVLAEQQGVINAFLGEQRIQGRRVGHVPVIGSAPPMVSRERVRPFQPRRPQRGEHGDMHVGIDDCVTMNHKPTFYRYLLKRQYDVA